MKTAIRSVAIIAIMLSAVIQATHAQSLVKYGLGIGGVGQGAVINTTLRSGDTLFIGGNFQSIGYTCGSMARYKGSQRDKLDETIPFIQGIINDVLPDGLGGWYVAGTLIYKGQTYPSAVRRILADGTLDVNFNVLAPGGAIYKLLLHEGSLYVGGNFTSINGAQRTYLAKIDPGNGFVDPAWNAQITAIPGQGEVNDMIIKNSKLYASGYFLQASGQNASCLASFSTVNGNLLFNYNVNGMVYDIEADADTLYAVGDYSSALGSPASFASKINLANDSRVGSFSPQFNDRLFAVTVTQDAVYMGGQFTQAGSQPNLCIAKLNKTSGAPDNAFQISSMEGTQRVNRLVVQGNSLYVAGNFSQINGADRRNFAELNRLTGTPSAWNGSTQSVVNGILALGSDLLLFGSMELVGVETRRLFAAINVATQKILPISANISTFGSGVSGLARNGSKMYLCGVFNSVNGVPVSTGLAELDLNTGTAVQVLETTDGFPVVMTVFQNKLYMLGQFSQVNGQVRNGAASVDLPGFALNSWNPSLNGFNYSKIAPYNGSLVVAGDFLNVNGQERAGMVMLDPATGALTSFNANLDGRVRTFVQDGNRFYVAGDFGSAGGQTRRGLALINDNGSLVTAFAPVNNSSVGAHYHLALSNGNIIVARDTSNTQVMRFRQLDGSNGSWVDTVPLILTRKDQFGPLPNVRDMFLKDSILMVFGAFESVNGMDRNGIAFIDYRVSEPQRLLSLMYPNRAIRLPGQEFYIFGKGFTPNTGIVFKRTGQPNFTVPGQDITYIDQWTLRIKLNLSTWALGPWNLELTIDGTNTLTLNNALTIENEIPFSLETYLVGPPEWGRDDYVRFDLNFRNLSNLPIKGLPLNFAISSKAETYTIGPISGWHYINKTVAPFDTAAFPPNSFQPYKLVTPANSEPYKLHSYIVPSLNGYQYGKISLLIRWDQFGDVNVATWANRPWKIGDLTNPRVAAALKRAVNKVPGAQGVSFLQASSKASSGINAAAASAGSGISLPAGNQGGGGVGGGGISSFVIKVYETTFPPATFTRELAEEAGVSNPGQIYGPEIVDDVEEEFLPDPNFDPFCGTCFPEDPNNFNKSPYDTIAPFDNDTITKPGKPARPNRIPGRVTASFDPNAKYGPLGPMGTPYLNEVKPFNYLVMFENVDTALAPARRVVVRDTLNKELFDLSSFQLTGISFGKFNLYIPPGARNYQNRVDLNPVYNKWVDIDVSLNESSGLLTVLFQTINPATGEPPINPQDGFLLPNNAAGEGQGSFSFFLQLKPGIADGQPIANRATIIFDNEAPISTNTFVNKLDRVPPQSAITGLNGSGPVYTLQGTGSDAVSKIYHYAAYYRVNGGLWREIARNQPNLNIPVTLSLDSIYDFVSIAIDSAGNIEPWPSTPDYTFPQSTGMQMSNTIDLKVFPNPVSGMLTIMSTGDVAMGWMTVYDMNGRVLLSQRGFSNAVQLDLSGLPSGFYNLEVQGENGALGRKVIQKL